VPDTASTRRARGKSRSRFIVLDGPDGAGKSTQVKLLAERLKARGEKVLTLREPGGTPAGEAIRKLLLEQREIGLSALTEAFLFQAARAQLVEEVIRPALHRGTWVICDRFSLSTLVYQGFAGGVKPAVLRTLIDAATSGLKPDRYIVLWVAPEVGVQRREKRGAADRMEAKGMKFIRDVARAFLREAKRDPKQYQLVPGDGAQSDVHERIWQQVEKLIR
jgi:dTMP kinase